MRLINIVLASTVVLFGTQACAPHRVRPTGTKAREGLPTQASKATVRIFTTDGTKILSAGSGFFVDENGLLLTNYHVVEEALTGRQKLVIMLSDKWTQITEATIVRCTDARDLDVCLLKVPYKPPFWFDVKGGEVASGTPVTTIGSTRMHDFQSRDGAISWTFSDIHREVNIVGGYSRNRGVRMLRMTAEIEMGFSGGPVFDPAGNLVGMSTVVLGPYKGDTIYLAIARDELKSYLDREASGAKYQNREIRFTAKERDVLMTSGHGRVEKGEGGPNRVEFAHFNRMEALKGAANEAKAYCAEQNRKFVLAGALPTYVQTEGTYTARAEFWCK